MVSLQKEAGGCTRTEGAPGGDFDSFSLQVFGSGGSLLGSANTGVFGGDPFVYDGSMGDSPTLSLSGLGPIDSARAQATSSSNVGVAFDDITFTPVPEPGTLGLLCFGGTGILAGFRRRRRK